MTTQQANDLPVLIIDDVDAARFVLRDMLRDLGFSKFLEARDGRAALDLLQNNPVQLIFCDYVMEGMSGLDFLNCVREVESATDTPIIFVSAVGTVSTVETVIEKGAADYLVKPISFRKLRRKVEDVLRRHDAANTACSYEISASDSR